MILPQKQSIVVKTSSQVLQSFDQQRNGNDSMLPAIYISQNNRGNYQNNQEIRNPSQQQISQIYHPYSGRHSSYVQTQNQQNSYNFQSQYFAPQKNFDNNYQNNMNSASSKFDEHQERKTFQPGIIYSTNNYNYENNVQDSIENNKHYDSGIGKERNFRVSNKNEEQIKRSKNQQNNSNKIFLNQDFGTSGQNLSSREIGIQILNESKKRYFEQGPDQLSNVVKLIRNRGNYQGQVKQIREETILEGIGFIELFNEDVYIGNFWKNYMHGEGYLLRSNGDFYNGNFQNDKIQGFGIYYYSNGYFYEAYFFNGLRQSDKAQYYSAIEDAWYQMPFDQDKKHGKGQKKDSKGCITNVEYFQGVQQIEETKNNLIQTQESVQNIVPVPEVKEQDFFYKKQKQFELKREERIKKAAKKEPKQNFEKIDAPSEAQRKLEVFISEGLPVYSYDQPIQKQIEGQAVYKFKDGSYYGGIWKYGIQDGFGIYYDSEVGLYEGDFINRMKNGKGNIKYLNGYQYIGSWLSDKKHCETDLYICFKKQQKYNVWFNNGALLSQKLIVE